jgi:hypothetical protein
MFKNLRDVLGLSALCFGLAAMPAHAGSSRIGNTGLNDLQCTGLNQTSTVKLGGFAPGSAQNVFAGEIFLFENRGGLQYVFVRLQGDPTKEIVGMGLGAESRAFNRLSEFTPIPVTANAAGEVVVQVDAACAPPGTRLQTTVTIWFN